MFARRHVALTAAAGCLSLLAVGCSSSGSSPAAARTTAAPTPTPLSAAAYRAALHAVAKEEDVAQGQVQHAFQAHTVAQVRAALAAFAADQQQAAARVAALTPPADAATANSELATAFSDNAAAINALVKKLAAAKTVKKALSIVQADAAGQRAGQQIDAALTKLKQLGYAAGS